MCCTSSTILHNKYKRWYCLTSVWRLSGASGLNREQRGLGRQKLAQRQPTSHITRTLLLRSKGQRSRSPGRFAHRGVNASGSCSGERGNLLLRCCLHAQWARRREALRRPQREKRGGAYCGGRPPTACWLTVDQTHEQIRRCYVIVTQNVMYLTYLLYLV